MSSAPSHERIETFTVADFSGPATLTLREIFSAAGAAGVRRAAEAMRPEDLSAAVLAAYAGRYPGVTLVGTPMLLKSTDGSVEVRASLVLPTAVRRVDDDHYAIRFDSQVTGAIAGFPEQGKRPLLSMQAGKTNARYKLRVVWPASVRLADPPTAATVDNAYFILRTSYAMRGNMTEYLVDYHGKRDFVVNGDLPQLSAAVSSVHDMVAAESEVTVPGDVQGAGVLSVRNFSGAYLLAQMRAARADATPAEMAQWDVPVLCEHLRASYKTWNLQTDEERAALAPVLEKFEVDPRPGVGACLGQMNLIAGELPGSVAWYARDTYYPEDRHRLEQSWARWYAGEHDAALKEALEYVVAARDKGQLDGDDLSLAISLYVRAGKALPAPMAQALVLPADGPWPAPLLAWQRGTLGEAALFGIIDGYTPDARAMALSDTWFHIGVRRLASGDKMGAATAFRWYRADGIRGDMAFVLAKIEQPDKGSRDPDFLAGGALWQAGKLPEAVAEWRLAAQRGDVDAKAALGSSYVEGRGVAKDRAEAHRWLEPAAAAGSSVAMSGLAAMAFDEPPNGKEKAFALLEQAVALDTPQAIFYLSDLYRRGFATPPDIAREIELERRAAEMDYPAAQTARALRYLDGNGVTRNDDLVRYWAQRAIVRGDNDGYALLARLLLRGDAADQRAALGMVRTLAESGNGAAMRTLGYAAMRGLGQAADPVLARTWYVRAQKQAHASTLAAYSVTLKARQNDVVGAFDTALLAAQDGDPNAQRELAWKYRHGDGTPVDMAASLRWLLEAVRQDDVSAINNLGDAYETGSGVPVDLKRAMELYGKAAQRGGIAAFGSLASVYEKGVGAAPNLCTAYTFLLLRQRYLEARQPGLPVDDRTRAMAAKLGQQDQERARTAALAWQPGQSLPGVGMASQ